MTPPFWFKLLLIVVFGIYCLGEFMDAMINTFPPTPSPVAWVGLAALPFAAFALRYGRPPVDPGDPDARFWWLLCGVVSILWLSLQAIPI